MNAISLMKMERLGDSLYRRNGVIYARLRIQGKRTWRSTETDNPTEARHWLKKWRKEAWMLANGIEPEGISLHRQQATVGELMDAYLAAGCPSRKMQMKAPRTVEDEKLFLIPIREYFGGKVAESLTLDDCDQYRDWRNSGAYISRHKVRGQMRVIVTKGGMRIVDTELGVLSNVLNLAKRRNLLKANPLAGRGRYQSAAEIRHCREVAPTPEGLQKIEQHLRAQGQNDVADFICFLAYSGLRINEALPLKWEAVNWREGILNVRRQKRGITPWVPILVEMNVLLLDMKARATSPLLFPSPFAPLTPRDESAIRRRLTMACIALQIGHVSPHGLRSYFVTQARQSGLTDADIAMLIGDKTGPAIIAQTYGDVRPEHLMVQAQRIRLKATHATNVDNAIAG